MNRKEDIKRSGGKRTAKETAAPPAPSADHRCRCGYRGFLAAVLAVVLAVSCFSFGAFSVFAEDVNTTDGSAQGAGGTAVNYTVDLIPVTADGAAAGGNTSNDAGDTGNVGGASDEEHSGAGDGVSDTETGGAAGAGDMATARASVGEEFGVAIKVSGGDYAALQLHLTYDSSLVSYAGKAEAQNKDSHLEVTETTENASEGIEGTETTGAAEGELFVTLFGSQLTDGSLAAVLTFQGIQRGNAAFGLKEVQVAPQGEDLGNGGEDQLAESQLTGCTVTIGEKSEEDTWTVTIDDRYVKDLGVVFTGAESGEELKSGANEVKVGADDTAYAFTVKHTEACVVACTTDGGATYTALTPQATDQADTYRFEVPVGTGVTVAAALLGDVNLDAALTSTDAILLNRYLAQTSGLTGLSLLTADTSRDGDTASVDAILLNRRLAQIITSFD